MASNSSIVYEIPSDLLRFHDAELIVGCISLIVNAMLLYFICFKTPPELNEYRPFIFAITVADFLFETFVMLLLRPVMYFPAIAAIITGPLKTFGARISFYFGMLGIFMFIYCMFTINLAFYYRYACVAKNSITKRTQIILHLSAIAMALCAISYPATLQEEQQEFYTNWLYQHLRTELKGHMDQFIIVAVTPDLWVILNFILVFVSAGLWNLIFAFLTVRKLGLFRASYSATTYKMHIRLVTFCPLFLLGIPLALIIFGWLLGASYEYFRVVGSGFLFVIAWHPLVNAVCTIFFVGPYRRLIFNRRWIKLIKNKMGFKFAKTAVASIRPPPILAISNPKKLVPLPAKSQSVTTIETIV